MAGEKISKIYCWKINSDKLSIYLASSGRGAVRVGLGLEEKSDCPEYFSIIFPSNRIIEDKNMNRLLIKAVSSALKKGEVLHNLPLDISCTPFQLQVWKTISKIPNGKTKTYGEIAFSINKAGGARAVGQAMKRNPLPLIFP